jgi:hypothetical protein
MRNTGSTVDGEPYSIAYATLLGRNYKRAREDDESPDITLKAGQNLAATLEMRNGLGQGHMNQVQYIDLDSSACSFSAFRDHTYRTENLN